MRRPTNLKLMWAVIILWIVSNIAVITLYLFFPRQDPEIQRLIKEYAAQLEQFKREKGYLPDTVMGPLGPIGPSGDKGEKGDTGLQGPQGVMGLQGTMGLQGPEGPMGPQGETGATGPQGEQGPQGEPGQNGREVEFRCNPANNNYEYRYVGDDNWHIIQRNSEACQSDPI